jgi:hypothetical protein
MHSEVWKKELPMDMVQKVSQTVQMLFDELAEEVGEMCSVIKRKRKFTAATLARTFVFGCLQDPKSSDEQLAQMAAVLGVTVTPQAVEQRYSPELVHFLQKLFERAVCLVVKSPAGLAPLLDRFEDVLIIDSTTISLPDELADVFPGCGGSLGGGKAALKLQVQLSLKNGTLDAVNIESGRDCDVKTPLQHRPIPAGGLRIADLGYFNTAVLRRFQQDGVHWISRLLFATNVYDADGNPLDLMNWLNSEGLLVDQPIRLGAEHKVACRLIAWRVPQEVAARRRQKLLDNARRKGRTPSAERLAWCDWMILVTSLPAEQLKPNEACVLYRSRWQIELLFKRWKSQGRISDIGGTTVTRQMVRLWSRLLAVVVQHWLVIAGVWGNPRISLKKACDAIRKFGILLAANIDDQRGLQKTVQTITESLQSTARQNKRKRPSTFELLQNPDRVTQMLT